MPQNASCLETEVVWKKDLTSEGAVFTIETSVLGSRKTPAGGGHGLARLLLGEWACSPRRSWVARTGSPACFAHVNCFSLGRTERCGDGRSATRSRTETHFILLEKLPCFLYHTDLLQFPNATNVRVFQSHLHNKSSNARRTKRNDMITIREMLSYPVSTDFSSTQTLLKMTQSRDDSMISKASLVFCNARWHSRSYCGEVLDRWLASQWKAS